MHDVKREQSNLNSKPGSRITFEEFMALREINLRMASFDANSDQEGYRDA